MEDMSWRAGIMAPGFMSDIEWPILAIMSLQCAIIFSWLSAMGAGAGAGAGWAIATAGRAIVRAIAVNILFIVMPFVKSLKNSISRTARRGGCQLGQEAMTWLVKSWPFDTRQKRKRFDSCSRSDRNGGAHGDAA